jgi:hypothetical protein
VGTMDILKSETKNYCIAHLKLLIGSHFKKIRLNTHYDLHDLLSQIDIQEYRYFWFEEIKQIITRDDGIITYESQILSESPRFFINAYVETYEDVLVNNKHLATQMQNLGWTHIVRNISVDNYWTEPFRDGYDKLIDAKGNIREVV